ncbi:MAG: hypothetical protein IPH88_09535 [Bacteroidales bacterium]|nr:hypothetical protein [Bacteroidales bacterium]
MKKKIFLLTIIAIFLLGLPSIAQDKAAEKGPFTTTMAFTATSTSDDSVQLKAVVSVKHEEGATFLMNAAIDFSYANPEGDVSIGQAKTGINGAAILKVPASNNYTRDEAQLITFKASYAGNDKYESSDGEFLIKPSKLTLSFYEEDSIKYVKVEGIQYEAEGKTSPLGGVDVAIAIPKMFSMLKVGQISLDSTGIGSTEFPTDIIGDSLGNLTVVAAIDEHEVYGFVQANASNSWGLHKHLISPDRPSRELWTPIAPLWMIITLIIMLAGVWGHYVYAVVQLVMIKKSSERARKKKEKDEKATA